MQQFLFKPENFTTWSTMALDKIQRTIDSCTSPSHFEVAKVMIDHYILTISLNESHCDADIQDISKQLFLYLNIKQSIL